MILYQLILEQKTDKKISCDLTHSFIMLMILYQLILEQKVDKKRACDLTDDIAKHQQTKC